MARGLLKVSIRSAVFFYILFLTEIKSNWSKKIGGHGPFKLKILLLNRYEKGPFFNEMIGKIEVLT